jgi:hypothetical protein
LSLLAHEVRNKRVKRANSNKSLFKPEHSHIKISNLTMIR